MQIVDLSRKLTKIGAQMRSSTRFPYTYACDLIRLRGLADSRSDASQYMEENGLDAIDLADQFMMADALRQIADQIEKGTPND